MTKAFIDVGLQRTIYRARPVLSTFHAFIFFGFSFFFLVNVVDLLEGSIPGFELVYGGEALSVSIPALVNSFNLVADILSVLTLIGMIAFLVRRFLGDDKRLRFNDGVVLHPKVVKGWIRIDSAIVGVFIIVHVGSRSPGSGAALAAHGRPDPFMPFASALSGLC